MIFTSINENNNIVFNEGFNFKSPLEAEMELKKISNNEKDLWDYINLFFIAIPGAASISLLVVTGIIFVISALLTSALYALLALPSSLNDKIHKCDKIINKCDKAIIKLSVNNDPDSKKLISEYNKVKNNAIAEKKKLKRRKLRESAIFDDVEFI